MKLTKFDVVDYLQTEQDIEEYLTIVLEENDPDAFMEALVTVARARKMQEHLQDGSFNAVTKVINALGFRLALAPM
ncbi:MAG: transcriptional regulator [Acinetobacter sp.]|nr:transcriptional regulator [Acinetobacter sp.]